LNYRAELRRGGEKTMNNQLLLFLSPVVASVLADLTGYARAREQAIKEPITAPLPVWDWPLFLTRLGIGVLTGSIAAFGIGGAN
jgi:hypothetical protein